MPMSSTRGGSTDIKNLSFLVRWPFDGADEPPATDKLVGPDNDHILGKVHVVDGHADIRGRGAFGPPDIHQHQQINIAIAAGLPTGVRAKQNNLLWMKPAHNLPNHSAYLDAMTGGFPALAFIACDSVRLPIKLILPKCIRGCERGPLFTPGGAEVVGLPPLPPRPEFIPTHRDAIRGLRPGFPSIAES